MSLLGKKLRVAAKAKAQARVGKAVRARKALLPELHEAHAAIRKVKMPREEGGKVTGDAAMQHAGRKPRTKKADGGSLGENIVNAIPRRFRRGISPQDAEVLANSAMGSTTAIPLLRGPATALAARARGRPLAEPVAEPMGNRPTPAGMMRDAEEVVSAPRAPMSPATAALTLGTAAALSGMGAGDDAGAFVPSRPERRSNPDMVIRANRPAPVPRETLNADRLNELSLAQSRMGPPSAGEMPSGAAELAAARNMAARRALIENNPTTGGVDVPFDPNMKRGGKVKQKSRRR